MPFMLEEGRRSGYCCREADARGTMSVSEAKPDFQLQDCSICSTPVFARDRHVLVLRMVNGRVSGVAHYNHESCFERARAEAWRKATK